MSTPSTTALILASGSSYRKQLLRKLQLAVECHSPNIDETPRAGETPAEIAQRLAHGKAQAVSALFPNHLIIGSDQTAEVEGTLLSKPGNFENAKEQLRLCSGKTVNFYTALCLLNSDSDQSQQVLDITQVYFRELSEQQIESYLKQEKPYDCAGSFKAEGLGIALFKCIKSNDPNSLIGLPLIQLCNMLINEGVDVLTQKSEDY